MATFELYGTHRVARGLLRVGNEAPDFSAFLEAGTIFRLSYFRGKKNVVLFFYPKDFTPGCTKEVCGFRDHYEVLRKYDAEIVGVSSDTAESHRLFLRRHSIPYTLIPDTSKEIARMYGAVRRLGGILPDAKRVTYVIDKNGIVRGVFHHELAVGKHIERSLTLLKRLSPPTTPTVP